MSERSEGDDFWVEERPFLVDFGQKSTSELDELTQALGNVLGWTPRSSIMLAAMCNDRRDHQLLAQLCLRLASMFDGVVDFGGELLSEPILNRSAPTTAVRVVAPSGLNGRLFAISYMTANGEYATSHLGDAPFLASWINDPRFQMVK